MKSFLTVLLLTATSRLNQKISLRRTFNTIILDATLDARGIVLKIEF